MTNVIVVSCGLFLDKENILINKQKSDCNDCKSFLYLRKRTVDRVNTQVKCHHGPVQ